MSQRVLRFQSSGPPGAPRGQQAWGKKPAPARRRRIHGSLSLSLGRQRSPAGGLKSTTLIQFARGPAASIPTLAPGQPGWTTDTEELYIGGASGNVLIGPGGSGSVTSVAIAAPGIFSVSGSPITSAGTITLSLANQNANRVFAGPSTGSPAAPTFRALVAADIPAIDLTSGVTGVLPKANGGTGTSSPGLTAGTGISITGTWPNNTIAVTNNVTLLTLVGGGAVVGGGASMSFSGYVVNSSVTGWAAGDAITVSIPYTSTSLNVGDTYSLNGIVITGTGGVSVTLNSANSKVTIGRGGVCIVQFSGTDTNSRTITGQFIGTLRGPSSRPGQPSQVEAATSGSGNVVVFWHASTGAPPADSYNVWYSTSASMDNASFGFNTNGTIGTVTGLSNGTPYYFAVEAVSSSGACADWVMTNGGTPTTPTTVTTLLYDTFTDTNGTGLASHTPDYCQNTWSVVTGSPTIQSNQLQTTTGGSGANTQAVSNCTQANVTITSTFSLAANANSNGFIGRWSSSSNYWLGVLFGGFGGAAALQIRDVQSGVNTVRASAGATPSFATPYTLTFIMSGTSFDLSYTGTAVGHATFTSSFNQTATSHGISFNTNNAASANNYFDTLTVTTP